MIVKRYGQLRRIVKFAKPQTIVEVGTHDGIRADMICREALKYRDEVHYTGYDLFEEATREINDREKNGKGAGSYRSAQQKLDKIKMDHPGFTWELVRGDTRKTLHGTEFAVDFAFIDGGHSVKTIQGDYLALRRSRVIALDDWYEGRVDTTQYGCNEVLKGTQHVVLPTADKGRGVSIRIAAVGYDPKWIEALESTRQYNGIDTISQWRGDPVMPADLIACLNIFEGFVDPVKAFDEVKKYANKGIFFTIKEDALRSIAKWREIMDKHWRVEQWYGEKGEVCGTAIPLQSTEKISSFGAWDDDRRLENIKANLGRVSKRIHLERGTNHGGKVILVCYGPSLKYTWPEIQKEADKDGAPIVSVSGAHDFLIDRGIVPKFHVECDPRPHKAKNLNKPQQGVAYYMASVCHPDAITKLLNYDLWLWHLCNGMTSIKQMHELEPNAQLVMGGGNAGLRAIALFYALGYREFSIHGMDCSFESDKTQHAGEHAGKRQIVIDVKAGERWFKSSAVLVSYVEHFKETMKHAPDAEFWFHGDGLLQHYCKLMTKQEAA